MEKRRLDRQDSDIEFQRHAPGCAWSILHVLDYHYWQNFRKTPPRIRNRRGQHAICCGFPKTISFEHYTDELRNYLDADAVPLLEQQTLEDTPSKKISGRTQVKALVAKEMSARSEFQQAISISQIEHSDDLGRISTDWPKPIIILDGNSDTAVSRLHAPSLTNGSDALISGIGDTLVKSPDHNFSDVSQFGREISNRQFLECVDVVEIFKMDKKLPVEILHDPNVQSAKTFQAPLTSDKKFTKSGSFPLAVSPYKIFRPVKLEHKWNEIWSFPKGGKLVSSMSDKLTGSKADDDGKAESDLSTPAFLQGSTKHGWHLSFMRHLKGAMKKIKHTHKSSKKKKNHTSINALHHRFPSRSDHYKPNPESSKEVKVYQDDVSMDKYAHRLEYSMISGTKWHEYQSKSFRLTNEDKFPETGSSLNLKSFRRKLSLPDFDSFSLLTTVASNDEFLHSRMPIKTATYDDINAKNISCGDLKSVRVDPADTVEETELHENTVEECKCCKNDGYSADLTTSIEMKTDGTGNSQEELSEPEKHQNNPREDQEISAMINMGIEHETRSPISVLETHFQYDIAERSTFLLSKDSSADIQVSSSGNSSTVAEQENTGNVQRKVNNNVLHFELNKLDDADFNYVRNILELSGIIDQGYLGTWHSVDQPLSPALFRELEVYLHQELECISDNAGNQCDHQLLFDLINEILHQICEGSSAYFPKLFSFSRRLHPSPKRHHVVEEVWKRISWYRNPRSKMDWSLDDIIGQDLVKDDSWMNLQLDADDTVLDLEDLIFYQLMDEVIFCL